MHVALFSILQALLILSTDSSLSFANFAATGEKEYTEMLPPQDYTEMKPVAQPYCEMMPKGPEEYSEVLPDKRFSREIPEPRV